MLVPVIVGLVLALLLLAFALEVRTPEVTAIGAVAILLVTGVLTADDVLGAMSNPAPLTIIAMFIVSAALVRTGTLDHFSRFVTRRAKQSPYSAIAMLLFAVAALSAFTNNTPLVMMMIPIGIVLAKEIGESASKLLMPISFAAILGGTCTLIGTSTNLLVDGVAQDAGLAPFSLFEIAPVGVVVALAGVVYLILARRLLPDRHTVSSRTERADDKRYLVSAIVPEQSALIGRAPGDVASLNAGHRRLVDVIRDDQSFRANLAQVVIEPGDVLVMRCAGSEVMTLKEGSALKLAGSDEHDLLPSSSRRSTVIEALLLQDAEILGHRLSELSLRGRYNVYPVALHRRGANLEKRFEDVPLEIGDTLLLEGADEDLDRLLDNEHLINLAEPKLAGFRRGKSPIAIAVMAAIVIGAAVNIMPLPALVVLGVAIVLVTRCIEAEEAFSAVDWRIIALIIAMLAIGTALDKVGLVQMGVSAVTPLLGQFSPFIALIAIYALSLVLTELVTNNAVAVVVTPIAIQLATALGADPRPFVIAVMFAASASFLTPIGYQTNTLVYGAGGYRFGDFARFGSPLTLIVAVATLVSLALFWPLQAG